MYTVYIMQEVVTHSPEETQKCAERIVQALAQIKGTRGTGTIVALQGNLGAGKTVFVKGVAQALGIKETVTSPTFVIEKKYILSDQASWKNLIHIDAYRLESEEELDTVDWNYIATDPSNLIMLEWPEQVGRGVPDRAVWIEFEVVDDSTRILRIPTSIKLT